jgi:hypothetical protein
MHRTHNRTSTLVATLIVISLLAVASGLQVVPTLGSLGNILIDTVTPPSSYPYYITLDVDVINLYFGGVTWSGGVFQLYLSGNGFSTRLSDDKAYGPLFTVAELTANTTTTKDGYTVGNYWINGTIPESVASLIAGGEYWIKADDGATASVAVTDVPIYILASFEVVPTYGPGQQNITLMGRTLPAWGYATFEWLNTSMLWDPIAEEVPADELGSVDYSILAPDLGEMLPSGIWPEDYTTIIMRMRVFDDAMVEKQTPVNATFNEYKRGLLYVGDAVADADPDTEPVYLYGNNTDLTSDVEVQVMGDLELSGKWFHPGNVSILWDSPSGQELATAVADAENNGTFVATIEIPITWIGTHTIVIDDTKILFFVNITVTPSFALDPTEGPVDTVVNATGFGWPAVVNVTIWWDDLDFCVAEDMLELLMVETDVNGHFSVLFNVPDTFGGVHDVTATTDSVTVTATFTVTPLLWVEPEVVTEETTLINVYGSGLDPTDEPDYLWFVDNHLFAGDDEDIDPDCRGHIHFQMLNTFCCEGTHAVYAIVEGETQPADYPVAYPIAVSATFEVQKASELDAVISMLTDITTQLDDLDDFVRDDSAAIHNDLDTIQDDIASAVADLTDAIGDVVDQIVAAIDLSALDTKLTSIETYAQTAATAATSASSSATTAANAANAAKTAAEGAQSTVGSMNMILYGAILLSGIAALAAIVAVIVLQRKVA